jgi:transcription termination/antitermination protein NusA
LTENNIYQLIKNLAEREGITEKEIIDMLSLVVQDIYRQKKPTSGELKVTFDPEKKQFMAYHACHDVRKIKNPTEEFSTKSSKKNFFQDQEHSQLQPLNLKEVTNYEEILKHLYLSLQRSRQKKLKEELMPLQGKIIEGTVQEVYHNYCLVNLPGGKGLGYWGKKEWLFHDVPFLGQSKRFLVKEVKEEDKYPVILVRRSEEFLRKILAIEIPEIAQGKIIIQDILRWPGAISKVIVRSEVPMSNLLGACIGERGIRIQNIEKEMSLERIELVEWKKDKKEQLIKLFSPVEVLGFCKLQKKDDLVVIIRPEQFSLALALKGKIIKLIENYLKTKIKILTWEEVDKTPSVVIEIVKKGSKRSSDLNNNNYQLDYKYKYDGSG